MVSRVIACSKIGNFGSKTSQIFVYSKLYWINAFILSILGVFLPFVNNVCLPFGIIVHTTIWILVEKAATIQENYGSEHMNQP